MSKATKTPTTPTTPTTRKGRKAPTAPPTAAEIAKVDAFKAEIAKVAKAARLVKAEERKAARLAEKVPGLVNGTAATMREIDPDKWIGLVARWFPKAIDRIAAGAGEAAVTRLRRCRVVVGAKGSGSAIVTGYMVDGDGILATDEGDAVIGVLRDGNGKIATDETVSIDYPTAAVNSNLAALSYTVAVRAVLGKVPKKYRRAAVVALTRGSWDDETFNAFMEGGTLSRARCPQAVTKVNTDEGGIKSPGDTAWYPPRTIAAKAAKATIHRAHGLTFPTAGAALAFKCLVDNRYPVPEKPGKGGDRDAYRAAVAARKASINQMLIDGAMERLEATPAQVALVA